MVGFEIKEGHVLDVLKSMESESVQCVMTSPPFWSLRTYKTPAQIWGGDRDCHHAWGPSQRTPWAPSVSGPNGRKKNPQASKKVKETGPICRKCSAWRGELGLEPNVDCSGYLTGEPCGQCYCCHITEIFREVRRVLRKDGLCFVNMDDCYAGARDHSSDEHGAGCQSKNRNISTHQPNRYIGKGADVFSAKASHRRDRIPVGGQSHKRVRGLKPGDLVGVPHRLARWLQADGWYWRDEIIIHKLNPTPESTRSRCTRAHQYLFVFAKNGQTLFWVHPERGGTRKRPHPDYRWQDRLHSIAIEAEPTDWQTEKLPEQQVELRYRRINIWTGYKVFYDQEAIKEKASPNSHERLARTKQDEPPGPKEAGYAEHYPAGQSRSLAAIRKRMARKNGCHPKTVPTARLAGLGRHDGLIGYYPRIKQNSSFSATVVHNVLMRNKRSVWETTSEPFKGSHYATFGTQLVIPCILAATSEKGSCSDCGAPYARIMAPSEEYAVHLDPEKDEAEGPGHFSLEGSRATQHPVKRGESHIVDYRTLGWSKTCDCPATAEIRPCVVLDPFMGSGTTILVANRLGRYGIGIDLNREYVKLARERIINDAPLFLSQFAERERERRDQ